MQDALNMLPSNEVNEIVDGSIVKLNDKIDKMRIPGEVKAAV